MRTTWLVLGGLATLLLPVSSGWAATMEATVSYESPRFLNEHAVLTAGKDGNLYLVTFLQHQPCYVLRMAPDGANRGGGGLDHSAVQATANKDGVILATHRAWNTQFFALYDRHFNMLHSQKAPIGDAEAGEKSGDFYVTQGNEILRIAPDGHLVKKYANPTPPKKEAGLRFRVSETQEAFYVLGGDGRIHCIGFDGKDYWQLVAGIGAGLHPWGGDSGGFDVDEKGVLYAIAAQGNVVKKYNGEKNELGGGTPAGEIPLPADSLKGKDEKESPRINSLRVVGGDLVLKRLLPTEICRRYDLKTGAFKQAIQTDGATLRATYPDGAWTAGQDVPLKIELVSAQRTMEPRWRVYARPLGSMLYRELSLDKGLLKVPEDLTGLVQIKVSPEVEPRRRLAPPELSASACVTVQKAGASGTANAFTPANRLYYGRGEAIPFSLVVRAKSTGNYAATVRLLSGASVISQWTWSATPGKEEKSEVPAALTTALRPGSYVLMPEAKNLTPVPQFLEIGAGMCEHPVYTVVYGDYGATYRQVPQSLWDLADACAVQRESLQRMGFNFLVDRWGHPDAKSNLAVPEALKKQSDELEKRLSATGDGVAPEKARFEPFLRQLLSQYSADGVHQMAALMGMDPGLPFGAGGFDQRKPEQFAQALTEVTQAFREFPAFRGWNYTTNWWLFDHRGEKAGRDAAEKAAYKKAWQTAKETGVWDPVLQKVCDYRANIPVETWATLNKKVKELMPGALSAVSGPFRNVECYPPACFSNVDMVDLQAQFEQLAVPYHVPFAVDFYRRPGKRAYSHPELGNECGTHDHFLPQLFLALARGSGGVGTANTVPNWGHLPVDSREGRGGWLSGYRRLNEIVRRYGPWLATLENADRVAIPASERQFKVDAWGRVMGVHFARVFEAYMTCLHAHRPASIVFTDDLTEEGFKRFRAVLLVDQWVEPEPKLAAALKAAKAAGTAVLYDAGCREQFVKDYTLLGFAFDRLDKDLSPAGDDAAHWRFPQYARANLEALRKALDAAAPAPAVTENDEVFICERKAESGRYLFVVNQTSPDLDPGLMYRVSLFCAHRLPELASVKLAAPTGAVYDAFALRQVAAGNDTVLADCRSLPCRVFAMLPKAIERVELRGPATAKAGQAVAWSAQVVDQDGAAIAASVPLRVRLVDAAGATIEEQNAAAGSRGAAGQIVVPLSVSGELRLEAAELFGGKGAQVRFQAAPATLPLKDARVAEPAPASAKGAPQDATARPVEEGFGPHIRDIAIADNGRLAVLNAFNWDANLYGVETETGAVRFRQRAGHYFAFEPKALPNGFCVQGYDLTSVEGYHLYLAGNDGEFARRFATYAIPGRLPHRFLPTAFSDFSNNFAVAPDGSWVAAAGNLGLAAWSRDGRLLWSQDWLKETRRKVSLFALNDQTLLIFEGPTVARCEASSGKTVDTTPVAPAGEISGARASADGRFVALRCTNDGGRICLLDKNKVVADFPTAATEFEVAPDGSHVVVARQQELKVYSAAKGLRWVFCGDEHLRGPRVSPDGQRVAVATDLGSLYVLGMDGRLLLERDMDALCATAWLPDGDLLVASWLGSVCRLGPDYREKWRVLLRPEATSLRGKLLAKDETPTTRIETWGNAEATAAPLTPNLLAQLPFKIAFFRAQEGGGPLAALQNSSSLLFDGKAEPPAKPWIDWSPLNYACESQNPNVLVLDAGTATFRLSGITLAEDPAHPELWLRDAALEYWDLEKKLWVKAQDLLSNSVAHTHRLKVPFLTTKVRLTLKSGQNSRLAEIVLHGEPAGEAKGAEAKKDSTGKR